MADRAEWHAQRRTGVGGSDAAAILGLSHWQTPFDVYQQKIGAVEPAPEEPWQRWGKLQEPIVRLYYEEATGRKVTVPGFLRHPKYPWIVGNPDGVCDDGQRGLEIKTTRFSSGWGEPGSDEVPREVSLQCHHYMLLIGRETWDVAAPIYMSPPTIYTIEADPEIAEMLIERAHEFWQRVQRREPPDPTSVADAQHRWGALSSKGQVVASDSAVAAWTIALEAQERLKKYTGLLDGAKLLLMDEIADHGDTLVDSGGRPICTWKLDKGTKGYTVEPRPPGRRLLIKGEKE